MPFFSISGSDFVEMFVGVGASRVRDMFEQGTQERAVHHLHRRDRRRGPQPRRTASAAATTSASRRSTRCWSRWTASTRRKASSSSPPPTGPTCSTRRCCGRAASTARSSSTCPTSTGREAILKVHAAQGQARRRTWTCASSPAARRASPAPTWRTCSTRPPCSPRATNKKRRRAWTTSRRRATRCAGAASAAAASWTTRRSSITAYHEAGHAARARPASTDVRAAPQGHDHPARPVAPGRDDAAAREGQVHHAPAASCSARSAA